MWLSRIPEQPVDSIFLQYIIFSWARLLYFNTHTHKHTHVIPSVFGIKRARLDQPQSPRLDQVAQPETMKPNITLDFKVLYSTGSCTMLLVYSIISISPK